MEGVLMHELVRVACFSGSVGVRDTGCLLQWVCGGEGYGLPASVGLWV